MTWYLWVFLSMIAGSFETVIDKVIVIKKPEKIDVLIATFYRNFGFFVLMTLVGFLGFFGELGFVFNIPFLILAIIWPLNSFAYDYFLRNIEVSRFNGIFYVFPLIFLFVDTVFFHGRYSTVQVVGILFLVLGAVLFSIEATTKKFIFSLKTLFWIFIRMIPQIYLLVVYKYYSNSVNDVSFFFSVWAMLTVIYVVAIVVTKKYQKLKETALADQFLAKTFLAKGFDVLSSIFYLEAIGIASLTAVSAFNSFSPLIMLIVLLCTSLFTRINIAEDFSRKTLVLKIIAAVTLITGGICMFAV